MRRSVKTLAEDRPVSREDARDLRRVVALFQLGHARKTLGVVRDDGEHAAHAENDQRQRHDGRNEEPSTNPGRARRRRARRQGLARSLTCQGPSSWQRRARLPRRDKRRQRSPRDPCSGRKKREAVRRKRERNGHALHPRSAELASSERFRLLPGRPLRQKAEAPLQTRSRSRNDRRASWRAPFRSLRPTLAEIRDWGRVH